MTKRELLILNQTFQTLDLKGVKFNYAIAKNSDKIKSEVKALQKIIEMSKDYKKFDDERIELVKKYSKKDDLGLPMVSDNQYILDNKEEFDVEFELLKDKHKTSVEEREKQLEEYNEILNERIEIDFYKIKLELIPENISTSEMSVLFPLIIE